MRLAQERGRWVKGGETSREAVESIGAVGHGDQASGRARLRVRLSAASLGRLRGQIAKENAELTPGTDPDRSRLDVVHDVVHDCDKEEPIHKQQSEK